MTGLYLLIIFFLGAGLGIVTYALVEEKEIHKADVDHYKFSLDSLQESYEKLYKNYEQAVLDCHNSEEGVSELEQCFEQMILDYQDLIKRQSAIIEKANVEVNQFRDDLAKHKKICPAFTPKSV